MYLTKIEMDRRSPSVRQALKDCEDMHRNVQKIFSESRQSAGVLYTVHASNQALNLYLLSKEEPDSNSLSHGMKIVASKDLKEFEKSFEEGKVYAFHLCAHPSKKVHVENAKNSHRIYLRETEQQIQWLKDKGMAGGFEILSLQIQKGGTLYSSKKENMKLPFVEYMGYLRIADVQQFQHSWENGIGPEKAFGLGMLMIQ